MSLTVLLRGGGDLASGVAIRLVRAGWNVTITELPQPMAVRRSVSFAQAVYSGEQIVEGVKAVLVPSAVDARQTMGRGEIAVLVDPTATCRAVLFPQVIVDGRMTKQPPDLDMCAAKLVIGLGPGFTAGENCHAVIETKRGGRMGRVIWQGSAEEDTGMPEAVANHQADRVLRAPNAGVFFSRLQICEIAEAGQLIGEVGGNRVEAPFRGLLRGLISDGLSVEKGMKIGDIDPRIDPSLCRNVSDKALAVGGGVLEAILATPALRPILWI